MLNERASVKLPSPVNWPVRQVPIGTVTWVDGAPGKPHRAVSRVPAENTSSTTLPALSLVTSAKV
jgi:hypothetical protein